MNRYRPRQKKTPEGKESGLWLYTKMMNEGRILAVGYCANKDSEGQSLCKHKSPLDASNCYRRYIKEKMNGKLPGGFPMEDNKTEILIMTTSD